MIIRGVISTINMFENSVRIKIPEMDDIVTGETKLPLHVKIEDIYIDMPIVAAYFDTYFDDGVVLGVYE